MSAGTRMAASAGARREALLALPEAAVRGVALGLVAAALYVLLDPHLRPIAALAFLRSAPHFAVCFAVASLACAGIACALAGGTGRLARWGRRSAMLALPVAGLVTATGLSDAFAVTRNPRNLGFVVTRAELHFVAALAVVWVALAPSLVRWADGIAETGHSGSPIRWAARVALAAALVVALALGFRILNGAPNEPVTASQVVVIGIDGADWRELRPLIARGAVPQLAALVEGGASGEISTYRPSLSPSIWTTVATGQSPPRHGITAFIEPESNIPFTSNMRRVPALWNLLGERGIPVGIVGWWITWPAEPVHGHIVSSYSSMGHDTWKGTLHEELANQFHPPELREAVQPLIDPALQAGRDEIFALLEGYRPPAADDVFSRRRYVGTWTLSADRMFSEAAALILRRHAPRLLAVYLAATDTTAHAFCSNNPWRDETCGRVLAGAYTAADRAVGRVLAAAEPDATIIVLSDHGFHRSRGHSGGFRFHGPPGVLIAKGDGIPAGSHISAASVYDVAPTILALFGIPIPEDWRGRALLGAFESAHAEVLAPRFAPPLPERTDATRELPTESPADELLKQRLRDLGYIE